ncbi:hypothetical protein GC174_18175 [bacterium]|nr:hypothetical protein [bacterium]
MANLFKLVGCALGALVGFTLLAASRGMLGPLFQDVGLLFSTAAVFGLVGLAIGTVIAAFEKDQGPVGIIKANLVGVSFLTLIAGIITFAMMAIPVMNPDRVIEPLSVAWIDVVYFARAILFIAIPASTGYYLVGRLVGGSTASE